MVCLWRVLFLATLAVAIRVDEEEDPGSSSGSGSGSPSGSGSESESGSGSSSGSESGSGSGSSSGSEGEPAQGEEKADEEKKPEPTEVEAPCKTKRASAGGEQDAARAAAVGAHAAGVSPAEVVKAAAEASKMASPIADPPKAQAEAELAATRALGLPDEVKAAGTAAYDWTSMRKGRSAAELAAADVAMAAQKEADRGGSAFAASVAAHTKAMEVEEIDGSGRGYMYGFPEQPTTTPIPGMAKTRGLYAMWKAHRAGEAPGAVVDAAVDACKRAGGMPSDVEDVTAIASDPMTFQTVEKFTDAKGAGIKAAEKAEKSGWPLPYVAMAAARAAADAQEGNPGQEPEDALEAGREAAEWVMDKRHMSPQEVAEAAAKKAKKKAEDYGHPPAKVQQLVAQAAAQAAEARGAKPDQVAKLADDARATVDIDSSGDWDTQQWDKRVYVEYDLKKANDLALKKATGQVDENGKPIKKEGEEKEGEEGKKDGEAKEGEDAPAQGQGDAAAQLDAPPAL